MKAKQYVAMFRDMKARKVTLGQLDLYSGVPPEEANKVADELDLVAKLCHELTREVKQLATTRRVSTSDAMVSVMLELQQKWEAVCRQLEPECRYAIPEAWGSYLEGTQEKSGIVEALRHGREALVAYGRKRHGSPRDSR